MGELVKPIRLTTLFLSLPLTDRLSSLTRSESQPSRWSMCAYLVFFPLHRSVSIIHRSSTANYSTQDARGTVTLSDIPYLSNVTIRYDQM